MPGLARVDDHGVRGVVQGLQVDAVLGQQAGGDGPVVDVQRHRAAVRMGQPDAEALRQIGLGLQGILAQVPAGGARTLGVRWDGDKAPAVSDVGVNRCRMGLHCLWCCHILFSLVIAVASIFMDVSSKGYPGVHKTPGFLFFGSVAQSYHTVLHYVHRHRNFSPS